MLDCAVVTCCGIQQLSDKSGVSTADTGLGTSYRIMCMFREESETLAGMI